MFMSARVAMTMTHSVFGDGRKYLTRRMRIAFTVITAVMLLCTLTLIALYPVLLSAAPVWIVFAVVLSVSVRAISGRRLTGRRMRRTVGARAYWAFMALSYLAPLGIVAGLLFVSMETSSAWLMLGGFAAGALLEGYALWRERDLLALEGLPDDIDRQTVAHIAGELREVNAYGAYQRMHMLVLLALQLTLVLVYTFIGLTTQELFTCMLLAMGCTVVMREVSVLCLRHVRRPFATQLLLIGLFLWIYGLFLFYRQMGHAPNLLWSYLALSLSVSGLTVSVTSLAELERRMTDVAVFPAEGSYARLLADARREHRNGHADGADDRADIADFALHARQRAGAARPCHADRSVQAPADRAAAAFAVLRNRQRFAFPHEQPPLSKTGPLADAGKGRVG